MSTTTTMQTTDQSKASRLIQRIKSALSGAGYSRAGVTWTLRSGRLDEVDDSTGTYHTVGRMSLMGAVAYVARTVGGMMEDSNGDSLEGDVIDVLRDEHSWRV